MIQVDCPNDGLMDCDHCDNERGGMVRCCAPMPVRSIECGCGDSGGYDWSDCEYCPECTIENHCFWCAEVGVCSSGTEQHDGKPICKECKEYCD